jgi:cytochrome c oxidase cbb3-type subunit III
MDYKRRAGWILTVTLCGAAARTLPAQNAAGQDAQPAPAFGGAAAFPSRPKSDAAVLARGKDVYQTNCAYCHGDDARGGENGGTNLLRSEYLMKDKVGEVLGGFLQTGNANEHTFRFTSQQISDLSAFIHDFRVSSRDPGRMRPPTIVVGDPQAGETYFQSKCGSCHSATGDLKGVASRFPDPSTLQQTWLVPVVYGFRGPNAPAVAENPRIRPVTVTVTPTTGQKVEGRLGRIDDFIVTLTEEDGTPHTFRREGDVPKVEVHDPMKPHKDLLPTYTDTDIHNVTAYLVTLK